MTNLKRNVPIFAALLVFTTILAAFAMIAPLSAAPQGQEAEGQEADATAEPAEETELDEVDLDLEAEDEAIEVQEATTQTTTPLTELVTNTVPMTPTEMITMTEMMTDTRGDTVIQFGENGITPAEFDQAFVRAMRLFANQQGIPINDVTIFFFADLRNQYMQQLAAEQVLLAEAEALGIEISDMEARDLIQPIKTSFLDDESYQQALRMAGFADEDALLDYVRHNALINAVLTDMLVDIEISDEEVRAFYTDNRELFRTGPGVILYQDMVEDQIRQYLRQQQLRERVLELQEEQAIELFSGNLTPFDKLLRSELMTPAMMNGEAITATATMTETMDAAESDAIDEVPASEIPPAAVPEMVDLEAMSISVADQVVSANAVNVASAFMVGPGWLVIHADNDGAPGDVLGYEALSDGLNEDVVVLIETLAPGDKLWAMLHDDTGEVGEFEFPEADPPAEVDGAIVMTSFQVLANQE